VLGADVVVPKSQSLFVRQDHDLSDSIRKALKHEA
jgi:hypothetical protein